MTRILNQEGGDFSPAGRGKILGILGDPQKKVILQIELAVVVDVVRTITGSTNSAAFA